MNLITKKLGLIMSVTALLTFIIYTVCFTAILFVNEPFTWTDLNQFITYETSSVTCFKYIGMGSMIIYVCAFVMLTLCVKENTSKDKRIIASAASAFAIAFCVCVSLAYFIQITSTRLQIQQGNLEGLLQFTQSYNISAISGINMLGWAVFYGLSSLFLGFSFDRNKSKCLLRIACFLNAVIMLAALIGCILNNSIILFLTMFLGLGGAGFLIMIGFILYFKKAAI